MSKILKAIDLAKNAHAGQVRKFSGLPYASHIARVAGRVSMYNSSTEDMIAAAYCHDVLEDTRITYSEMLFSIGKEASDMVLELTNPSKFSSLSRADRKKMDRDHISDISRSSKIIKFFDRIDNVSELIRDFHILSKSEKEFAEKYAFESRLLLDAFIGVDVDLETELLFVIEGLEKNISLVKGNEVMA